MTHHHHHHPKSTTTTKPTGQQEDWENVAVIVVAILIVIVLVTMCVFDRIKRFIKARCYSKLRDEDDGEDDEVTIDLDKDGNHALISEGDLIWLYISHALQAFGDRLWQFSVPILFMLVWDNTLLPTAIFQFALCMSTFLLTAPMGNWIDRTDRLVVFKNAVVGQNVCIIINCLLVWMLAYLVIPDCGDTFSDPCGSSTTPSPANNITTPQGKTGASTVCFCPSEICVKSIQFGLSETFLLCFQVHAK